MPAPASRCTCFLLRRAARQTSQVYDRELAEFGLSLNQYSILKRAAARPRTLGEFADELGMDRTTLTRNLRPLYDARWLREARGVDARQRIVEITAAGRERVAAAQPAWRRAQTRIEAAFGQDATRRLHGDLDALSAGIAATAASA